MQLGAEDLSWCLPLELFGDDASIWKDQKMLVMSWGTALFKTARTIMQSFLVTVLPYALVLPSKTLPDLHKAIAWSFNALLLGCFPRVNHLGMLLRRHHGKKRF